MFGRKKSLNRSEIIFYILEDGEIKVFVGAEFLY